MDPFPRRRWFGAVLAALATSCYSPTLPLPPPSRPDVEGPDPAGNVTLSGHVLGDSEVFALNARNREIRGQLTDSSGAYRFAIPAEVGDELVFWYTVGTEESPSIVITVNGQ
jgi:cytochrome oxidase assembly protein ShyY1